MRRVLNFRTSQCDSNGKIKLVFYDKNIYIGVEELVWVFSSERSENMIVGRLKNVSKDNC